MFAIGILVSIYGRQNCRIIWAFIAAWGFAVCLYLFMFLGISKATFALVGHAAINYIMVSLLLILLSKYPVKNIAAPAIISSIYFDIYLVHGKVYDALRELIPVVSLYSFIVYTTFFVFLFHVIRKKLIG